MKDQRGAPVFEPPSPVQARKAPHSLTGTVLSVHNNGSKDLWINHGAVHGWIHP